jgi:esterase/lipase superfamily enzyme
MNLISSFDKSNALVFVHGFNTTFRDATCRTAQIFWDLQYSGIPVLFSWPSRGTVLDGARDAFIEVLGNLKRAGARRIDILAHSMGNLVVLDSLARHSHADTPLGIAEIFMAAPDIDRDHYKSIAAKVR